MSLMRAVDMGFLPEPTALRFSTETFSQPRHKRIMAPKPISTRTRLVLFCGLLIVVAAARLLFADKTSDQARTLRAAASREGARKRAAEWSRFQCIPANPESIRKFCDKIDWSRLDLALEQESTLRLRIYQVFNYLEKPTFQEYFKLKTEGLTYAFRPGVAAVAVLNKLPRPIREHGPESIAAAIW